MIQGPRLAMAMVCISQHQGFLGLSLHQNVCNG